MTIAISSVRWTQPHGLSPKCLELFGAIIAMIIAAISALTIGLTIGALTALRLTHCAANNVIDLIGNHLGSTTYGVRRDEVGRRWSAYCSRHPRRNPRSTGRCGNYIWIDYVGNAVDLL
jgi:hypothetical protein